MKPAYSRKPIRFIFAGDKIELSKFIGRAKAKMNLTETQAKFQNLPQITHRYTLNAGIGCVCIINNNERVILIGYKRPKGDDKERIEPCECSDVFTTGKILQKYSVSGYEYPSGFLYDVLICQASNKKVTVTDCVVYDFSEMTVGDEVLVGLTARERFAILPFSPDSIYDYRIGFENIPWGLDALKDRNTFFGRVNSYYDFDTRPPYMGSNYDYCEVFAPNYIEARDAEFIYTVPSMCKIETLQAPGAIFLETLETANSLVDGVFYDWLGAQEDTRKLYPWHTRNSQSMVTETSMLTQLNEVVPDDTPRQTETPKNNFVIYPL